MSSVRATAAMGATEGQGRRGRKASLASKARSGRRVSAANRAPTDRSDRADWKVRKVLRDPIRPLPVREVSRANRARPDRAESPVATAGPAATR